MFIAYAPKVIFIHIQRTGGTTITQLLKQTCRNYKIAAEQHSNVQSLPTNFFDAYNTYQIFTFVRNPWARLYSWFSLLNKWNIEQGTDEKIAFEQFLMSDNMTMFPTFQFNQLDYITNSNGKIITNNIGRFEDFEKDVYRIFQSFGLKIKGDIPVINQSNNKQYRAFYTKKSRDFVFEKCQKDIEYFGYEF